MTSIKPFTELPENNKTNTGGQDLPQGLKSFIQEVNSVGISKAATAVLKDVNVALHDRGILPNINIVGVENGQLTVKDKTGATWQETAAQFTNDVRNSKGPDGQTTVKDSAGHVREIVDKNGNATIFTYDGEKGITGISKFNMDGSSEIIKLNNGKWSRETRDTKGNVTSTGDVTINNIDQGKGNYSLTSKNSDGSTTVEWTEADGRSSGRNFTFDADGRIQSVSGFGTAAKENYVVDPSTGLYRRTGDSKDQLQAAIKLNADGSFTKTYTGVDGYPVTETQNANGQVEQPVRNTERG